MANNRDTLDALTNDMRGRRHLGTCTACGSTRLKKNDRGNANDGDLPAWNYKCFDCNATTIGILVMLPQQLTTLSALDEDFRRRRRMIQRQNRNRNRVAQGLQPTREYIPRGNYRRTSDTIGVEIALHRGVTVPGIGSSGGRPSTYRIDRDHPPDEALATTNPMCWHCQASPSRANHLCHACTTALQRARPIRRTEEEAS